MSISKDEMRTLIREENEPLREAVEKLDHAIRGNGSPGLNQRVASLEQSRTTHKKLWGTVLGIIATVAGALITNALAG